MILKIVRFLFYICIAITASGLLQVAAPAAGIILSVCAIILAVVEALK